MVLECLHVQLRGLDASLFADTQDGYYLMHAKASNGMQSNNFKFSSCSHARIESRLNELIQNPRDWPFIQDSTGFCGNQVVERDANATAGAGEECDCGYEVRLQSAAISQICLAVLWNICIAPLERDAGNVHRQVLQRENMQTHAWQTMQPVAGRVLQSGNVQLREQRPRLSPRRRLQLPSQMLWYLCSLVFCRCYKLPLDSISNQSYSIRFLCPLAP